MPSPIWSRRVNNRNPIYWNPTQLGASLTEEWISGERLYQDSGATSPVTSADQTVSSWVGRNGTKLTTTGGAMKAKLINGILTPVSISDLDSSWVVPASISFDRHNGTAWMHIQAGSGWQMGFLGLGSDRGVEINTYTETRLGTYNATGGIKYSALAPLASPMILAIDGTATTKYIRRNAAAFDGTPALPSGAVTGGFFGALNNSGSAIEKGSAIYHGLAFTSSLDSVGRGLMLDYFDRRVPRPSDAIPARNIVAMGDSNSAGTQALGTSWPWLYAAAGARVVSSTKSGQFFSAGGSPMNGATNVANISAQYLSGAGKNVVIIADTNDFSSLTAAQALSNREAAAATWVTAGYEVCQPYMPNRNAPYAAVAAYNAVIATFNSSLAGSSAFAYRPDFSGTKTLAADGIHWPAAVHQDFYAVLAAAIG